MNQNKIKNVLPRTSSDHASDLNPLSGQKKKKSFIITISRRPNGRVKKKKISIQPLLSRFPLMPVAEIQKFYASKNRSI